MIRWMCGYTGLNQIRNEVIREKIGVAPIEEKTRETRLRWFCHVKRKHVYELVKRCEMINLRKCRRGRRR